MATYATDPRLGLASPACSRSPLTAQLAEEAGVLDRDTGGPGESVHHGLVVGVERLGAGGRRAGGAARRPSPVRRIRRRPRGRAVSSSSQ
ncbi:hypothetical protein ACH4E7_43985, partial [Kitasatospora sp. NPDC018058]|uniref:hypothetical protein n=1 Tax=Kitasatospora sp. NPDC018058 TaxID=3364025 RepID=UPI0037BFAC29